MGIGDGLFHFRCGSNFCIHLSLVAPSFLPGDAIADDDGGGDVGLKNGKVNHASQSSLKTVSLEAKNGKQKQNSSANGVVSGKGNGKITGVPSSLLGDIIAELDDLLDADFFNVATNSSDIFTEKGLHLT